MTHIYHYLSKILTLLLFTSFLFQVQAQRTVEVDPGFGTLNNAIFGDTTATGERVDSSTVYILKRDGLYLLDGTIENRFPLTIMAEEGSGARPILQPGVVTGGGSSRALTPRADITLKGLYITNLDEFGGLNTRIIRARGDGMCIVIDDCHLDKDGQSGIRIDNPDMKIYITNSIFSNIGLMASPNNGRGIDDRGNPIDTLVVENNTVYNLTSRFLRDDGGLIGYAKVTNNTFYNLGQGSIHFGEAAWVLCQNNQFINTSFLGTTEPNVGGMRIDSLTADNIAAGMEQCVVISHNNFYNQASIPTAYPDTVHPFRLFNGPAQIFMESTGYANTNKFSWVSFAGAPLEPTSVVTSYYATLNDTEPNPDNMDDGNGGPGIDQVQLPFNFNYIGRASIVNGAMDGGAIGDGNYSASIDPMTVPRVVTVDPGFGTLHTAIFTDTTATGERVDTNTVYMLKRDGIYLLDGTIENRFPLTIMAEEGSGARPILQPAISTGGGSSRALTPRADITLKGLYITNLDEEGGLNTRIIRARGENMRIIIDDCHLDKDGQSGIRVDNDGMKIYITNSIFSNIGLMSSPDNGRGIDDRGNPIDSLVIENTTAYNLTSRFLRDGGGLLGYARVVHNTFYNFGQGSIHFGETGELICANNLFVNTSFLGTNSEVVVGGMRTDILTQANIDAGLVQRVQISHNDFYDDPTITAAYPDTVRAFQLYDSTTLSFIDASGLDGTNVSESVVFTMPPSIPASVVTSYYATRNDTEPNPENMDDGNGGPGLDQIQMPFDFGYTASAPVALGSTKGEAMGSKQWEGKLTVGILNPDIAENVTLTNYPNPFLEQTTIAYTLPQTSKVKLNVFHLNGQKVETLLDDIQTAGAYKINWRPASLSTGIYVYRLEVNGDVLTKKLVYVNE